MSSWRLLMGWCCLSFFSLLFSGCVPLPAVVVPEKNAPIIQRLNAYKKYRGEQRSGGFILANGLFYKDPMELLPFVDEVSKTAESARTYARLQRAYLVVYWSGFVVGIGGATLATLNISTLFGQNPSAANVAGFWIGGGLALAGFVGVLLANPVLRQPAHRYKKMAFLFYNQDLLHRLQLTKAQTERFLRTRPHRSPQRKAPKIKEYFEDAKPKHQGPKREILFIFPSNGLLVK